MVKPTIEQLCRPVEPPCDYLPFEYVQRSASYNSEFVRFLCELFDMETIENICAKYAIGATKDHAVIFWQIDSRGRVRTGKIMHYDPETGHRIKTDSGKPDWVHSRLKRQGRLRPEWYLTQCFFGEHLLRANTTNPVAIVESEKTAIVCACRYPRFIWLATGGVGQNLAEKAGALAGRKVVLFPDRDAVEKWEKAAASIKDCNVSDMWKRYTDEELGQAFGDCATKLDLCDLIVYELTHPQTTDEPRSEGAGFPDWILCNAAAVALIEMLDLKVTKE